MFFQDQPDGVAIKVKLQPRASRNKVCGIIGDALKISLTAPPVDGAANSACIDFLAALLQVPKSSVEILSGHTARIKIIKIYGLNGQQLAEKIKY